MILSCFPLDEGFTPRNVTDASCSLGEDEHDQIGLLTQATLERCPDVCI